MFIHGDAVPVSGDSTNALWKCTARLLHFIPVLDDPVLNGAFQSQDPPHVLSLVSDVGLSLNSTVHNFLKSISKAGPSTGETVMISVPRAISKAAYTYLVFRHSNNGWENNIREVFISKPRLHQTRPCVQNYGGLEICDLPAC